jgi:hypothetical protein
MRNRMVDEGVIADGIAPSYFIEGMLSNVPAHEFGRSFDDSFCNAFNWIVKADRDKLLCANELYFLVRDYAHNCWPTANFEAYMSAAEKYWTNWGK